MCCILYIFFLSQPFDLKMVSCGTRFSNWYCCLYIFSLSSGVNGPDDLFFSAQCTAMVQILFEDGGFFWKKKKLFRGSIIENKCNNDS